MQMQSKCLAKAKYLGVRHGGLDECEVISDGWPNRDVLQCWALIQMHLLPSTPPSSFLSASSPIIPALLSLVSVLHLPVNLWPGPQQCGQRRSGSVLC